MSVPELEQTGEGVLLPVQALPRASNSKIAGWHAGRLKVCITQAPEKGKANAALLKLISKSLGIKRSQIQLLAGETSTQKLVCVTELTADQLLDRISKALGESS